MQLLKKLFLLLIETKNSLNNIKVINTNTNDCSALINAVIPVSIQLNTIAPILQALQVEVANFEDTLTQVSLMTKVIIL